MKRIICAAIISMLPAAPRRRSSLPLQRVSGRTSVASGQRSRA